MSLCSEFSKEGAILLRNAITPNEFAPVDEVLCNQWSKHSVSDPYSESCAKFATTNANIVSEIYQTVADLNECIQLAMAAPIKDIIQTILGKNAKIYSKVPLRIDTPLETKEHAVWHQDDFYVKGAPNEITAWIPLQDTPMHLGALSVMKKSHLYGKLDHDTQWGKKSMPSGVYDLPINIVEMKRGDVLLFNSFLLHTSNINFSNLIRYSIQIRFTSQEQGEPSKIMGHLNDL